MTWYFAVASPCVEDGADVRDDGQPDTTEEWPEALGDRPVGVEAPPDEASPSTGSTAGQPASSAR